MIYMQSTIIVRPEHAAEFHEIMKDVVRIQEEGGWKLTSAFVQFTGQLSTYVDIWEMEDAAHFQNQIFALRAHPDMPRIREVLSKAVVSETLVLGVPAPFLPQR